MAQAKRPCSEFYYLNGSRPWKATVMGWDVVNDYDKIRKHIGYMPGRFSLYQDLSVIENLEFYATLSTPPLKKIIT